MYKVCLLAIIFFFYELLAIILPITLPLCVEIVFEITFSLRVHRTHVSLLFAWDQKENWIGIRGKEREIR